MTPEIVSTTMPFLMASIVRQTWVTNASMAALCVASLPIKFLTCFWSLPQTARPSAYDMDIRKLQNWWNCCGHIRTSLPALEGLKSSLELNSFSIWEQHFMDMGTPVNWSSPSSLLKRWVGKSISGLSLV